MCLAWCLLAAAAWGSEPDNLPRFTEEREAAALFFVKKNLPELLPLLEELKKTNTERYQREIREVFQVTEYLAELQDDPRRHELELKIWVTESKAHALVAKLSVPNDDERKKAEAQLQELAKELVELDAQVLEHKADQLEKELGEVKDELARIREQGEKRARERYDSLLEKSKRPVKKK
jgi:hypothetical protein